MKMYWEMVRGKGNALAGQLRDQLPDCPKEEVSMRGGGKGRGERGVGVC